MSVRQGERSEGTLQVLNLSRQLAEYTLNICKQEKVFPKSQRWIMVQRIVNEAIDATTCIRRANTVYVSDDSPKEELKYRRMQQAEAHAHIGALLTLIDLSYGVFNIESRKIEYWSRLALDTDDKLKSWMRSDKMRIT